MDYSSLLPVEITLDIFSRLPTESVLDCKLVSKTWNTFVRHPCFGKLHLYRFNHPAIDSGCNTGFLASTGKHDLCYFQYNDESTLIQRIGRINLTSLIRGSYFVGSFNGLICLVQYRSLCVCNPITRECVMLPEIKIDSDFYYWNTGFGYVSSTDEYKIVVTYTGGEVYIYTLGSGKDWRKLGNFSSEFKSNQAGIFANGVLYWLDGKVKKIATFDLAEEKFCQHLSPPRLPPGINWYGDYRIRVLDGYLCISVRRNCLPEGVIYHDIWMLKKESVNHEMKEQDDHQSSIWSREFTIQGGILFAVTKSNAVLTEGFYNLNIFDIKTSTSKILVKFKDWLRQVSPHKNTFVSLKELGEKDTKTMEPDRIEDTRSGDYTLEQPQKDANLDYIYF